MLYAAARGGGVGKLWSCEGIELTTSEYAAQEAWRNLADEKDARACLERLADFLGAMSVVGP